MKRTKANNLEQLIRIVREVPEVALFSHVSPDGDTLGSMLALGLCLESIGKKITFFNASSLPANLHFLPGIQRVSDKLPEHLPKTLIFVDCADAERVLPGMKKLFPGRTVINIDHHVSNDKFGSLVWLEYEAAATGEMVYRLIKKCNIPMTKEIATNLYTAIITDTGRFSYSNTTPTSFEIAADLVKSGIDLVNINRIIFETKSLSQVKLLHQTLAKLTLLCSGKLAVIVLTREDFHIAGADESLSEGLVDYARNIENVEAAALIKEVEADVIKVSFRSNTWLDVNRVAAKFGGGGHIRAAGCTIQRSLDQANQIVIAALEEELTHGRNT